MSSLINHFYRFGDFTVDVDQRVLLRAEKPVALTPKALDTLLILLESSGKIVEKEDLKKRLWPDTFVEEANITFNIQQLRKCLGDDARNPKYIETVARRGYRFIADVELRFDDDITPGVADRLHQASQTPTARAEIGSLEVPPSRRGRVTIIMVALGILVLFTAGLISWRFLGHDSSVSESLTAEAKTSKPRVKLEQLTATGQSYHIAISPDGKYVAYERVLENKAGVWVRHLAANTNVELVPPSGAIYGLSFNSNGDYLYFVRGDPATTLYRVSLLGGPPAKIIENLEGNFSVSRQNDQIAFIRLTTNKDGQRDYSLITANADGSNEQARLTSSHPLGLDTPVWSPDGRSIICSYGNTTGGSQDVRIIEVNLADGQKRELSDAKFFRITKMAWLAKGSGLLLSARTNLGENNQLWRMSYPSLQLTQLTEGVISYADLSLTANADKGVVSQESLSSDIWVGPNTKDLKKITQASGSFSWAPDGRLVYSSTASGNRDLWIMRRDGTDQRQLTTDPLLDINPRVTPDNRYIVFISNRTGAFQVWRMNTDGSDQVQLTEGAAKNHISISGDSKWVFYNTTDDWHLWRVSIDGGEPVKIAGYVATLASMSPDQKNLVAVGRERSRRVLLVLPALGGQRLKTVYLPNDSLVGYRIKWTPDGRRLIYMNQQAGPIRIVQQSLDGGATEELARLDHDEMFDFDYSWDGQFLAVTRGAWQHDVVLISEFSR